MLQAVNELAGGVAKGRALKAIVPGGSSCPVLKADECDIPMDYDSLAKAGSMLGSGGMVVLDETTDMVKFLARIMKFYAHESCGWCIPCREGTSWLKKLLARLDEGVRYQRRHRHRRSTGGQHVRAHILPLGDAAAMPTMAIVRKFRHEFEAKIRSTKCSSPHRARARCRC